ncbi:MULTISPECIES: hypothetical protein [unclassified Lysobacter]|uniref:hypothetical protein n=1 Tax=unclassified Lysobacter TaxID=2635362 RepID=UPI0006F45236|nr:MULTISPECIES: hypothetical protein [unclassified Lysobacter]KRC31527.1 hypothetical protein ASE10_17530 [Lysobacter sp. Root76]KRD65434.1 hypothetical protein ASE45_18725 [Lysobacter sp. Root96]
MSQNLIDLQLPAESLAAIDDALNVLESHLTALIALTPDQRRQLTKMGDKSEAFCRQAVHVLSENPGIVPRNFEIASLHRDLAALDALRPRAQRLMRLSERVQDSEMALGSDLMTNALEGYAFLKIAGKGAGLDALRQMLSARFNRSPSKAAPAVDVPL